MNKTVTIQAKDIDRDDRIIADTLLVDDTNLNRELVKEGPAWWFFRCSSDEALKQLEAEAYDAKRGVWQNPIQLPPWV